METDGLIPRWMLTFASMTKFNRIKRSLNRTGAGTSPCLPEALPFLLTGGGPCCCNWRLMT